MEKYVETSAHELNVRLDRIKCEGENIFVIYGNWTFKQEKRAEYKETVLVSPRSELPEDAVLERSASIKPRWAMSLWRLLYLPHKAQSPHV